MTIYRIRIFMEGKVTATEDYTDHEVAQRRASALNARFKLTHARLGLAKHAEVIYVESDPDPSSDRPAD